VTFTAAVILDLSAAGLAVVLLGSAAAVPARARLLLVAGLGALIIRAGADLVLADAGWIFAARRLLIDLPLSVVPVLGALGWSVFGSRTASRLAGSGPVEPGTRADRLGRNLTWTAAGAGAVAAIDPFLLPGPRTLAVLIGLALIAPWASSVGSGAERTERTERTGQTGQTGQAGRPGSVLVRRSLSVVAGLLIAGLLLETGLGWWRSRLPGSYDLADFAGTDTGGAGSDPVAAAGMMHAGADHPAAQVTPVTMLTGPTGTPDVRVTLTAAPLTVRQDGHTLEAVAFNGSIPGPPIWATVGDLVEVHACNDGDTDGLSVHWHGYDVPNAEDGVAGVTQDAIGDGACQDYRFRADQPGSYWYHAHQDSSSQVDRGLYGSLVVAESTPSASSTAGTADLTVLDHAWRPPGGYLTGAAWQPDERSERSVVAPGTAVRLRLVNTDRLPHRYRLIGARFTVTAVDGAQVSEPGELDERTSLLLAAGGRYDLSFTMPAGGVRLTGLGAEVELLLTATADGSGPAVARGAAGADLDLLEYGSSVAGAGDLLGRPDREFSLVMDRRVTFAGGRVSYGWAVNGQTYPRMPMLMVATGDLVRVRLVNRTTAHHPMHLHGHRVRVLSRNGRPATGAPWWSDTLNVAPGEEYVIAFQADNPGIWMDHCHDLQHAADGFVLHLAYTGVSTPFRIGSQTANRPE
jgi:FtsP/CotA-like multicopper oxidase with cupredoxin domain